MVISVKDALKLFGVSIICCCAVLVCTMFINYYIDLSDVRSLVASGEALILYEAQLLTSKVTVLVTGGCLLATSVVTLLYYVRHFIDIHKKELGILKAFGYSNTEIALRFWVFGLSVLVGAAVGFALAFAIMPTFYDLQNETALLPDMSVRFHAEILAYLVVLPTIVFSAISVVYARYKLGKPVIELIKDNLQGDKKRRASFARRGDENTGKDNVENDGIKNECNASARKSKDTPFLKKLSLSVLSSQKTLVFFIWFASFCFSAMTQMSISMKDLSSVMMGAMMMVIGLALAFTTLILAITTVINGNSKTIATMRAMGYSQTECANAIFGGYRPFAYVGFAIGTAYQYGLLKIMVSFVFKDFAEMPSYSFDWKVMLITLAVFALAYEGIMLCCSLRIRKIPIKQIMIE